MNINNIDLLNNSINFDECSYYWNYNKKKLSNGYYIYKCQYIHQNGKICNHQIFNNELMKCKRHLRR